MIEIKKSEYKDITVELIEADIAAYRLSLENWRNSEGIAKPYANYWFTQTIVENNIEYKLIDDNQEADEQKKHNELIDINNDKYDYSYARSCEYGDIASQIEYITENGLDSWQNKVTEIKNKYPKPE